MKKAVALLALLTLLFCLTGCFGKPSEGKTNATAQKGEQMMREWLASRYPDAELVSAEPYVFHNLGIAPYTLTNTVSGTFRSGGKEQSYWLDTSDGTVYFEGSDETAEELGALCAPYVAEVLGLGGDCEVVAGQGAYFDIGVREQPNLLPADFVRSGGTLESLVRSPQTRPAITVSVAYRVSDAFDVSCVTFAEARRVLQEYGLLLDAVVRNGSEEAVLSADSVAYQRMAFADLEDFRVWMPVYERDERLKSTGEVETKITERDASRDLVVERTADGFYRPSFPNGWFPALIYAYDGSEMLRHTYYYVSDNDQIVEMEWRETERGWQLGSDDNYLSDTRSFAELK